jgi:hypothetical protein
MESFIHPPTYSPIHPFFLFLPLLLPLLVAVSIAVSGCRFAEPNHNVV